MSDTKISQLTELAETFDVDGEVFIPVVDTGDTTEAPTGTTKRYSLKTLLAQLYWSGWGDYDDDQYTEASPFALSADSDTILPNNAAVTRELELPFDIANDSDADRRTFYDVPNQKILGRAGDSVLITIEFKAKPTSGAATYIETWFDIGGVIPPLYRRITSFPKGTGVERTIVQTTAVYTLDTWETNGADVFVRSNGPVSLYDIRYVVYRNHKGRGDYS